MSAESAADVAMAAASPEEASMPLRDDAGGDAPRKGDVTRLLLRWRGGDREALDHLLPLVYEELRGLAARKMRGERPSHTLQTTGLVHEAFLRLVAMEVSWNDRAHFLRVAAQCMRRILVDHARARGSARRGGAGARVTLDEAAIVSPSPPADLLALDEALTRLAQLDARKSEVIELCFFGGLTQEETASAMGVSRATVERELRQARAWLYRELR